MLGTGMRLFAAGFAIVGLLAAVPVAAQQPIVVRFSHVVAEDTPKGKAAAYFKKLAANPEHRIALLGDSEELGISHQYVELIGKQHGISVQSFRDEAAALQWIRHKTTVRN